MGHGPRKPKEDPPVWVGDDHLLRPHPRQKGARPRPGGVNRTTIGVGLNDEELAMLEYICEGDGTMKGQAIRRLIREEYRRRTL